MVIIWRERAEKRRGGSFGIERPRSRRWKTRVVGGLENWAMDVMDVICVSSLNGLSFIFFSVTNEMITKRYRPNILRGKMHFL